MDDFLEIAKQIRSNFFTMDIAKTEAGGWIVIEVGDGQVSGLPEGECSTIY
ncbi:MULTISPECIES: ATP-grasp domain-containing protein [unclassified Paenibacillus]|uniref:ATP-grasp domain-containing protein n=1 Tax=unclassified Paenibacillus TaxID=185978 RepID=UPI0030F5E163